jgi:hypothetical protein
MKKTLPENGFFDGTSQAHFSAGIVFFAQGYEHPREKRLST